MTTARKPDSNATPVTFGKPQDKMYRLLITGSRDLPDADLVWTPLYWVLHKYQAMILVHGDCPTGADNFGEQWYQHVENADDADHLVLRERYAAQWAKYPRAQAGPIRNQQMVDLGADACFGFPTPQSRGTFDCMARAWVKGIPVYWFNHTRVGAFHRVSEAEGEALARRWLHWGS